MLSNYSKPNKIGSCRLKRRDLCIAYPVVDLVIELFAKVLFSIGVIQLDDLKVTLSCYSFQIIEAELVCYTTILDTSLPVLPYFSW